MRSLSPTITIHPTEKLKQELTKEANKKGLTVETYIVKILESRREKHSISEKLDEFMVHQTAFNNALLAALKGNSIDLNEPLNKFNYFKPQIVYKLYAENIKTLQDLLNYDLNKLWRIPGIGNNRFKEIESFLLENGLISEKLKKL